MVVLRGGSVLVQLGDREATGNLAARSGERETGVGEESSTPAMSWSAWTLRKRFNAVGADVAPRCGEVAKHCFDTGVTQTAAALENWRDSKSGARAGKRVGFPSFESRHTAKFSVSFVESNHQLSWLNNSRHAVRLMLPQALIQSKDPRTRRCAQQLVLVEDGRATIQKVTISCTGGTRGSGCLKAEPSSCIDHDVWRQCSDLDGTPATTSGTTA